jgi:hypothetical protein
MTLSIIDEKKLWAIILLFIGIVFVFTSVAWIGGFMIGYSISSIQKIFVEK